MTTDQSRKFIQEYISAICKEKSEATIDRYVSDEHLKSHIIIFEANTHKIRVEILDRFFRDYIVGSSIKSDLVDETLSKILH
ncbi:MAG: hypothetical protein WD431_11000, partial [Cyclobacteriaceae bacterium]